MCPESASLQSAATLWPDTGSSTDMLPAQRCPRCGCAEEAGPLQLRGQMRFRRMVCVSLSLLLGVSLASLVLLLFGSPALLRRRQEPTAPEAPPSPEAVSDKRQDPAQTRPCLTQRKKPAEGPRPSALMTIQDNARLHWQFDHGNTHSSGGMTFNGGHLTVPVRGLYRVYVQITFFFERSQNNLEFCDEHMLSLEISVRRKSSDYKAFRDLLQSQDTMSCNQTFHRTVFTSGTFLLEAQTELNVAVSPFNLVVHEEARTFFGAELNSAL